jgi:predicted O-methyltransferase YrrM
MSENQLIDALLTGKPYFGPAMRAMQSPAVRHRYLGALVRAISPSRRQDLIRILEIGSWAGASAITWAKAVQKLGREGMVTCVDQWQPYFDEGLEFAPHYRAMNKAAKNDKVFKLFLHNIRAANVSHMVNYLVGDTRKILPELPGAEFDIVYIDASHLYENVRADIQDAKRLIRDGGIICGDDLELQRTDVDDGEHRTVVNVKKDFVHSRKADAYYHPGVTEAVAVEFGEVSSWEGVWATRKLGSQWARVELDAATVHIPDHIKNAAPWRDAAEVGQTRDYLLFKVGEGFIATAKSLGSTNLLIERLGERQLPPVLFNGESLEEVRTKALESEEERCPSVELIDATNGFNLLKIKGRFLAAAKLLGPTELFNERLGERELAPFLLCGESLEAVREKAVVFEQQNRPPSVELIEGEGEYNLLKAGDRYFAVSKALGPVSLLQERLGERELAPFLFSGEGLEAVREKAIAFEQQNRPPSVELIEGEGEYNLLKAGDRYFAVSKALGPVSLLQERLGERELPPVLFVARSLEEAKRAAQGSLWKRVNAGIGRLFRRLNN